MVDKSRRRANHNHIGHLLSPLGEIVSENLETMAADIVFIPDPRFAALKLHGAEFPW